MRQFDFMGKRRIAFIVSILLTIVSVAALALLNLNLGLDFTGGTVVELHYASVPALDAIREQLASSGFDNFQVQTFGAADEILVRLQQTFSNDVGNQVVAALSGNGTQIDLIRAEYVGAQVGDQLRDQSGLGMLVALAGVAIYVAFRFQYKFALCAIISLVHDVVIVLGLFALFQWEFDLTVLAGIMAVIGYSLNDTIIVYDRIRENIRLSRIDDMPSIFNSAINQTLARTLATSGTTLLVLFALFFLGGDMIHNFSISLILGIIAGTFSSVYVAAALLIVFKLEREDLIPAKKENIEEEELP
ncbi:protein translocase subunit SecF [Salinicola avicenniae]|uniref:protein translocase subunit SecF n=1 Tax=Salinicola avicenniae TaxID=2916836 RepID=UPI002072DE2A|nr:MULTISPECIES: protein translocase subunit SecF [unclassified Salinicola]